MEVTDRPVLQNNRSCEHCGKKYKSFKPETRHCSMMCRAEARKEKAAQN